MELKELKQRKEILEQELTSTLQQFLKETGIKPMEVKLHIQYADGFDENQRLVKVRSEFTLNL